MLQKNFPERKNIRRKMALNRLQHALKVRQHKGEPTKPLETAIANTKSKIVDTAWNVKTKKPGTKRR